MGPIELTPAGLAGTAAAGAIFSGLATAVGLAMQLSAHKTEMMLKVMAAKTKAQIDLLNASMQTHDAAAGRKIDGGKTLRYWIALALIAMLLNLILAPLMGQSVIVRDEVTEPEFLLIFPEKTRVVYTYLRGYFFAPITVYGLTAYISCLVGSAAVRLKL